jgi:hypothetical protein
MRTITDIPHQLILLLIEFTSSCEAIQKRQNPADKALLVVTKTH